MGAWSAKKHLQVGPRGPRNPLTCAGTNVKSWFRKEMEFHHPSDSFWPINSISERTQLKGQGKQQQCGPSYVWNQGPVGKARLNIPQAVIPRCRTS